MGLTMSNLFSLLLVLLALGSAKGHILCTDLESPSRPTSPLTFCNASAYQTNGCCSPSSDAELRSQFTSYNISDAACAAVVQQSLCATCDPWSAHLFGYQTNTPRTLPYFCTSPPYCAAVFQACRNVFIVNSPFSNISPLSQVNNVATRISDVYPSQDAFCSAFGLNTSICFAGAPVQTPPATPYIATGGLCLEKIANGTYINMAAIPGGNNQSLFFASQFGKVRLLTIPPVGGTTPANESGTPFLDLSSRVVPTGEMGLLGFAVHPNYSQNGKVYVAYSCNSTIHTDCQAPCACDGVTCDPYQLPRYSCTTSTVIAEYIAPNPSTGPANLNESRRILTISKPYTNNNGGQLLFGHDGYLYFMCGDGGGTGDPWNFAQTTSSLLGKILRLDIDTNTSNPGYIIPPTNPFLNQTARPEIYALGFRNPWKCSFDRSRPTYFLCGDVGTTSQEEIDLIPKGGNMGWRLSEGNVTYNAGNAPGGITAPQLVSLIPPIITYDHAIPNKPYSVTGGYVYRGTQDACQYGNYIYADLYGTLFSAEELPIGSGRFGTAQIPALCSGSSSPNSCGQQGAPVSLQYIFSFGEDNNADLYILTAGGVYRVTSPDKCGLACTPGVPYVANLTSVTVGAPAIAPTNATGSVGRVAPVALVKLLLAMLLLI